MEQFTFEIKDKNGMHARPAGALVNEAKKYKSDITVIKNEKEANGKRLLSLMSLGATCGSVLTVKIDGEDEKEARKSIEKVLKDILSEG
jgi:phosphocarrier protein